LELNRGVSGMVLSPRILNTGSSLLLAVRQRWARNGHDIRAEAIQRRAAIWKEWEVGTGLNRRHQDFQTSEISQGASCRGRHRQQYANLEFDGPSSQISIPGCRRIT